MIRKLSILCVSLAAVCLLSASYFFMRNFWEAEQARQKSEDVMVVFEQILRDTPPVEIHAPAGEGTAAADTELLMPEAPPVETNLQEPGMTEAVINGHSYIGYLRIPILNLELPIMADWDYDKLQISPCRYYGSISSGNLVLTAHNYQSHFGTLHQLQPGDEMEFVDMDNVSTPYRVAQVEVIEPTAIDLVTSGAYDLVLFTCTYGGQSRVAVFCDATN